MYDPRGHHLETFCEIDLSVFARNIEAINRKTGGLPIILAVKANAYGHGIVPICLEAEKLGIKHFGVATLVEGVKIRDAGITGEIIILTPPTVEQMPSIVYHSLSPNIPNKFFAEALSLEAGRQKKIITFHIEVDTGMGRTGIPENDAVDEIRDIVRMPNIQLNGIFTHFPVADSVKEDDISFTRMQIRKFGDIVDKIRKSGIKVPMVHISNSAGILDYPIYGCAVRPGLLAYGLYPSPQVSRSIEVFPVLSLKTRVVQLRDYPAGSSISYGRTYITEKPSRIAVIRAGYGDGIKRVLSNKGFVLVKNKRRQIVGTVCMDTTMVLVDDTVLPGDEVIVIGKQGNESISADDHAFWANTINYEILTGISERVPRVYLRDGKVVGILQAL